MNTLLLFQCLAAGSLIMNREVESASMRPLAKALTRNLDILRSLLRDQCLKDQNDYTENISESLAVFDRLFAEFELRQVDATMIHVFLFECVKQKVTWYLSIWCIIELRGILEYIIYLVHDYFDIVLMIPFCSYVSAMVPVKTMKEYDLMQDVVVLFCETVERYFKGSLCNLNLNLTHSHASPRLLGNLGELAIEAQQN